MARQTARDCHQRQGTQNGSSNPIKYQFAMHRRWGHLQRYCLRGHALWGQPVSTGGESGWRRC
jgi:hypothetical protein